MISAKKIAIGSILCLTILIALLGYLSFTGKLVFQASAQTTFYDSTCDDEKVIKYNDAALSKQRNGSDEYSIDKQALNDLVSDITSKASYKNDPTCQTIIMLVAIQNNDYNTANQAYDVVRKLHHQKLFANSNLATSGPLANYQTLIDELSPSRQNSTGEAQGGQ